jgi:bifunctional DNA-binding transcriptional regulator/antitoxin component of YhaV-PrlF toxin-antitoxin module
LFFLNIIEKSMPQVDDLGAGHAGKFCCEGTVGTASLPSQVPAVRGRTMSTLTVTAKGQVTLRKDLLKHLGVHPGEEVTVEKLPNGRIEVKAARPTGKISDVFDFLKEENSPSLSIEEMKEVAAQGWAGRR